MSTWDPKVKQPDLRSINGGSKFTANTPITADIMNMIVNMLIYLSQ